MDVSMTIMDVSKTTIQDNQLKTTKSKTTKPKTTKSKTTNPKTTNSNTTKPKTKSTNEDLASVNEVLEEVLDTGRKRGGDVGFGAPPAKKSKVVIAYPPWMDTAKKSTTKETTNVLNEETAVDETQFPISDFSSVTQYVYDQAIRVMGNYLNDVYPAQGMTLPGIYKYWGSWYTSTAVDDLLEVHKNLYMRYGSGLDQYLVK